MNTTEIAAVKTAFRQGNLYWRLDQHEPLQRVRRIGAGPKPEPDEEPEPGEVAYVEGGRYVALDNAELHQFCKCTPIEVIGTAAG